MGYGWAAIMMVVESPSHFLYRPLVVSFFWCMFCLYLSSINVLFYLCIFSLYILISCIYMSFRSIIGFLGALKNNSILLWIVSFHEMCYSSHQNCSFFLVWIFLDVSLAVSDHAVLHIGGDSGIHCFSVSLDLADAIWFLYLAFFSIMYSVLSISLCFCIQIVLLQLFHNISFLTHLCPRN